MEALLIYNGKAKDVESVSPDELQQALLEVGYQPVYKATSSEEDLDEILREAEGLVVVAGGDGTLRAVATRIIEKDVALCLLPLGTANNVAKALDIERAPLEIIANLEVPAKRHFDVGYVQGPWGEDFFLEGMGWGFYANALAEYDPNAGKSWLRSIKATVKSVSEHHVYSSPVFLDGRDISGDLIWLEVMNTPAIGPRLKLAPDANPSDGLFEIVCVTDDDNDNLLTYATNLVAEELVDLPNVELLQGRELEFDWSGFAVHIDAEVRPEESERPSDWEPAIGAKPHYMASSGTSVVTVKILPKALEFWLPNPSDPES